MYKKNGYIFWHNIIQIKKSGDSFYIFTYASNSCKLSDLTFLSKEIIQESRRI